MKVPLLKKRKKPLKNKRKFTLAIDSGAHSLYEHVIKKIHGQGVRYSVNDYWKTDEFWTYVDQYIKFLSVFQDTDVIDMYVNVDVIFNPEATWEVQRYMESKGFNPIPVYHYGENRKHLVKMMDNYEYIGIGGVGQDVSLSSFIAHGDAAFKILSDDKGYPIRKTHGFALTSNKILWRYPFYTVDSSSWVQFSQYGIIIVPNKVNGEWYFGRIGCTDGKPREVTLSSRNMFKNKGHTHIDKHCNGFKIGRDTRQDVIDWLEYNNIPFGVSEFKTVKHSYKLKKDEKFVGAKDGKNDRIVEMRPVRGVVNDHEWRDINNYLYYMHLESKLPDWPWPNKLFTRPIDILDRINKRLLPKHTNREKERPKIIIGGNFDLQVYKWKEERMRDLIFARDFDYNRMVSFFFGTNVLFDGSDKIKNILAVKQEHINPNREVIDYVEAQS